MLVKTRNHFITGIVIILPAVLTVLLIRYLVAILNNLVLNPLAKIIKYAPFLEHHSLLIAKALIFFLAIGFIVFIGWAAHVIFLRKIFGAGERLFLRVPMIGKVYSVAKEIGSAFLGEGKTFFKRVVLVEYPRKGIYSVGFEMSSGWDEVNRVSQKDLVGVFVPTTPNPTSGFFLLMPREEVHFLDMSIENGLKLVVSSGAIVPPAGR